MCHFVVPENHGAIQLNTHIFLFASTFTIHPSVHKLNISSTHRHLVIAKCPWLFFVVQNAPICGYCLVYINLLHYLFDKTFVEERQQRVIYECRGNGICVKLTRSLRSRKKTDRRNQQQHAEHENLNTIS